MDDVQKARAAVCEVVRRRNRWSGLDAALDAYAEAVGRRALERAAALVDLPAADPRSPTRICGWLKEPVGLAAWLRSLARPTEEGR